MMQSGQPVRAGTAGSGCLPRGNKRQGPLAGYSGPRRRFLTRTLVALQGSFLVWPPLCLSSNALDDMFRILTLNGTAMCQTEAHMQKTNQPTNPQNPDFFHLFHFIFFVFNLYHELNMLQKHRQKSDAHVTSWINVNKEIVSFFIPLGLHMAYGIKSQCG